VKQPGYSGVVYIDEEAGLVPKRCRIEGHWEPPGTGRAFEEGPGWAGAAEAIAWGRKRAPRVLLRVHRRVYCYRYLPAAGLVLRLHAPACDDHAIYSAGEDAVSHDEVRRWPGALPTRDTEVLPDYGGTVWLVQWPAESDAVNLRGLVARWEKLTDGVQHLAEIAGPNWEGGEEEAVEWARQRAPYVLICNGPPRYGYLSAGEIDPPGLDLPRWRSLAQQKDHLRDHPPDVQYGAKRWITTLEDESKSFPLPGIEPADS
jgi:hypothetical protein